MDTGRSNLSNPKDSSTPRFKQVEGFDIKYSSNVICDILHQQDQNVATRQNFKSMLNEYQQNLACANGLKGQSNELRDIIFKSKKSFFNHKESFQEIVRSRYVYQHLHDNKYSLDQSKEAFNDIFEDALKQVMRLNMTEKDTRHSLKKWAKRRLSNLTYMRNELKRQYFQLFSMDLQDYQLHSDTVTKTLQLTNEAIVEQEELVRNLCMERFFENQKQYQENHLPKFFENSTSMSVIIEQTFQKKLKNFQYLTPEILKNYFNEFSNHMYCGRQVKQIRLTTDVLPYQIHLSSIIQQVLGNTDAENLLGKNFLLKKKEPNAREFQQKYRIKEKYFLRTELTEIQTLVSEQAPQRGINGDIQIDGGCLLLFAIDQCFQIQVDVQSKKYLEFVPYDLQSASFTEKIEIQKKKNNQIAGHGIGSAQNSPPNEQSGVGNDVNFSQSHQKQSQHFNVRRQVQDLLNTLNIQQKHEEGIKVRSGKTWLDLLQVIPKSEVESQEQFTVLKQYNDIFIESWIRFLLFNDKELIKMKFVQDMSILEQRATTLFRKQVPDAYFEFYERYLKLIYLNSRDCLTKILGYMNYFRVLQQNLNMSYVQLTSGHTLQGSRRMTDTQSDFGVFDPLTPLSQQPNNRNIDTEFFMTNPSLAHNGNVNFFGENSSGNPEKEDYFKINGQIEKQFVRPQSAQSAGNSSSSSDNQVPNVLYEQEQIQIKDEHVLIQDHNNLKIVYDTALHDFHELTKKFGEIGAYFFQFYDSLQMQTKDSKIGGSQDNFLDSLDRESLIDTLLALEQSYYFSKTKVLMKLHAILKNCFYPDLRQQLIEYMVDLMSRRPRISLFENKIFESYRSEIESLETLHKILVQVVSEVEEEEKHLYQIRNSRIGNPNNIKDKYSIFYFAIQGPSSRSNFSFEMSHVAKLVLNIQNNRKMMGKLIPASRTSPKEDQNELLQCEVAYYYELLESTKKILYQGEGLSLFEDYFDFKFLENDSVLDQPQNFELVAKTVLQHSQNNFSLEERGKVDFDCFTILQFLKIRQKFFNFSFGLSALMQIYQKQVGIMGQTFQTKFQENYQFSQIGIGSRPNTINYVKSLLDLDQIQIFKFLHELNIWIPTVLESSKTIELLPALQSFIILTSSLTNCIVFNNLYYESIREQFQTREQFQLKLEAHGPQYFQNIFHLQKQISQMTVRHMKQYEIKRQLIETTEAQLQAAQNNEGVINQDEQKQQTSSNSGNLPSALGAQTSTSNSHSSSNQSKNAYIAQFANRLKYENQYENLRLLTLYERNYLVRFFRRLPFPDQIHTLNQLKKVSETVSSSSGPQSNVLLAKKITLYLNREIDNDETEFDGNFFDRSGTISDIYSLPSIEDIFSFNHQDFANLLVKHGLKQQDGSDFNKAAEDSDESEDEENFNPQNEQGVNQDQEDWDQSHQAGGKEWFKDQLKQWEKNRSLFSPNLDSRVQKGVRPSKGYRTQQFFKNRQLLYLRKSHLFTLYRYLSSLKNILSVQVFLASLEANQMDVLYFHNGLLSSQLIREQEGHIESLKNNGTLIGALKGKAAVPEYQRNELRLRRDFESVKELLQDFKENIKFFKNKPEILDFNDAIISYIEKISNRVYLNLLCILVTALNNNRLPALAQYFQKQNDKNRGTNPLVEMNKDKEDNQNQDSIGAPKTLNSQSNASANSNQIASNQKDVQSSQTTSKSAIDDLKSNKTTSKNSQSHGNQQPGINGNHNEPGDDQDEENDNHKGNEIHINRTSQDFIYQLRRLLIAFNFQQFDYLVRYPDDRVGLMQTFEPDDDGMQQFVKSPDLRMLESSSPAMDYIRSIFSDTKLPVREHLHSTMTTLNPTRYFLEYSLKTSTMIDKSMIGVESSKITELSSVNILLDNKVREFLRNQFLFQQDNPYKYERFYTKFVNWKVRFYIMYEIYLSLKYKIYPFSPLPQQNDQVIQQMEITLDYLNQEIEQRAKQEKIQKINIPKEQMVFSKIIFFILLIQCFSFSQFCYFQIVEMHFISFEINHVLYEEAFQWYSKQNDDIAYWLNNLKRNEKKVAPTRAILGNDSNQDFGIPNYTVSSGNNLTELDVVSLLGSFHQKIMVDSVDINLLNQKPAFVIKRDQYQQNLIELNYDLMGLLETKYLSIIDDIQDKYEIIEKDVIFEQKQNKILKQKIRFLEQNIYNIVESQVALRTSHLSFELEYFKKELSQLKKEDQVKEFRLTDQIREAFQQQIRDNLITHKKLQSGFLDFRNGLGMDLKTYIDEMQADNINRIKESLMAAFKSYGGSATANSFETYLGSPKAEQVTNTLTNREKTQNSYKSQHERLHTNMQIVDNLNIETNNSLMKINSPAQLRTQFFKTEGKSDEILTNLNFGGNQGPGGSSNGTAGGGDQATQQGAFLTLQPENVHQRIQIKSKEIQFLLTSIIKLRTFYQLKMSLMKEKYEKMLQQINQTNLDNEDIFSQIHELQKQNDDLRQEVMMSKKTISVMEYQNDLLRRDIQRNKKDQVKMYQMSQKKQNEIADIEKKLNEMQEIETLNSFENNNIMMRTFSQATGIGGGGTVSKHLYSSHSAIQELPHNEQFDKTLLGLSSTITSIHGMNRPSTAQNNQLNQRVSSVANLKDVPQMNNRSASNFPLTKSQQLSTLTSPAEQNLIKQQNMLTYVYKVDNT